MGREDSVAADVDDAPRPRFLGGQKAKIISFVRCDAFLGEKQKRELKGFCLFTAAFVHIAAVQIEVDRSSHSYFELIGGGRRGLDPPLGDTVLLFSQISVPTVFLPLPINP